MKWGMPDFLVLLCVAAIITIPGVYLLFTQLMLPDAQYYHAPIGVFEMVVSLGIVLSLGLTTIFSQTLKAANANPVENLKVAYASESTQWLKKLQDAAVKNQNMFEALMEACKYCSLGQLTNALFEVGGQYRRNM